MQLKKLFSCFPTDIMQITYYFDRMTKFYSEFELQTRLRLIAKTPPIFVSLFVVGQHLKPARKRAVVCTMG